MSATVSTTMQSTTLLEIGTRTGDRSERAWDVLADRIRPRMKRWFERKFGFDEPEAEDLAQRTLTRVYRHGHRFDPDQAPFLGWLHMIGERLAKVELRDLGTRPELRVTSIVGDELGADWWARQGRMDRQGDPEDHLKQKRIRREVEDALDELSPTYRHTFRRYLEGWSYDELQEEFSIPYNTCKSRIRRAREQLRPALREWGIEPKELIP